MITRVSWGVLCLHWLYLWVFLLVKVLRHVRIKVLCIAFVQTVDFTLLLDFHVSIYQNELADCLKRSVVKKNKKKHFSVGYNRPIFV